MLPDSRQDRWLDTAVSGIRFSLDRQRVRRELEEHIEDKLADLRRIFPDIPEEEARGRALSSMGDPEELKTELARVHKPWWGRLWMASRWALWLALLSLNLVGLGTRTGYDNSLRGRTGTEVYHRVQDGERARLGQYTFQITGAAWVDRSGHPGARDSLQLVLRASCPKFWERADIDGVLDCLTAVGPDGNRYGMSERDGGRYAVVDELGNSTVYSYICTGGVLCRWEPWYREFAVFLPTEGWEPGDPVTLELDSRLGKIELSAPVTERVVLP